MSPLPKVLIVDDDPRVVQMFSRILLLEGYAVLASLDAESGLRNVDEHDPNGVFVDLRMPLVDGLTFLRRIRARATQRNTPVVILTGDYTVDEATTRELHELGADLYFKPVWRAELLDIVRRLVPKTA